MNRPILIATVCYLFFVVYGSLVPLNYNDLPIDKAIQKFRDIPFLNLAAGSRADWVANILLYIPLSFGILAAFGNSKHPLLRALATVFTLAFCFALAVVVEFCQLFFPPRSVLQNDLLAEAMGSVIGVLGWKFFGAYFLGLYRQLVGGNLLSVPAAIIFYLLAYYALNLFPFDFVNSWAELNDKLSHGNDAIIIPFSHCGANLFRCGINLSLEVLVLLPLGLLIGLLLNTKNSLTMALLVGLVLGLTIESVQVFMISGSGQGISLVTRMVGMGAGALLFAWSKHHDMVALARFLPRVAGYAVVPYLLLVLLVNDLIGGDWLTPDQALVKLQGTQFLPLYYYYYTSETVALISLLSQFVMYYPVGLLSWAAFIKRPAPHWFIVGLLASVLALLVETGKLFASTKHADPSDVLLAFTVAASTYALLHRFLPWLGNGREPAQPALVDALDVPPTLAPALPAQEIDKNWRILSVILVAVIAVTAVGFPVLALPLSLFLLAYTVLLAYYPKAWLVAIPALLPVLDFAPWTGRFFFDEFDLLVLTTLMVHFWRKPKSSLPSYYSTASIIMLAVFALVYFVSFLRGILPLQALDANTLANYYSNYNSFRVGKGFLWALLLMPMLHHNLQTHARTQVYFGSGMLLGFAAVIVVAIWERLLFPGLLNFSSDFRIIALFSTMHTGGGHIDAYLALAFPFIAMPFLYSSRLWLSVPLGVGLFVTGLYVLLVTFSRGPYLAVALGFVVLALGLLWCFKANFAKQWYKFLIFPLLLALVPLIAIPVFEGTFINQRFSQVNRDSGIRMAHWEDAAAMMDDDFATQLFGMGLGSYPRIYALLNSENVRPASYRFESENSNQYLKLKSGDALYMGQYVATQPHKSYQLSLDLRGSKDTAALTIPLCEKSLMYSFRCSSTTAADQAAMGQWRHVDVLIDSGEVGTPLEKSFGFIARPVQLGLNNAVADTTVDVDNVSLKDEDGKELMANGDFSRGMDHWYFATENHSPWHILNLPVHLLFDQGWLGAVALYLLFMMAVVNCGQRAAKQKNAFAVVLLSAFTGFMVVGMVDSPFDAPRLALLFFLLLFLALARQGNSGKIPIPSKSGLG
jgi:VanZ family protein